MNDAPTGLRELATEYVSLRDEEASPGNVLNESLESALTAMRLAGYPAAAPSLVSSPPPPTYVRESREASERFGGDPARTGLEILRSGWMEEQRLHRLAHVKRPPPLDQDLVSSVHLGWFNTTFPDLAGKVDGLEDAAQTWRRANPEPRAADADGVISAVSTANTLAVAVRRAYPRHTRLAHSLRNYALMLCGVDRVVAVYDDEAHESALRGERDDLDQLVLRSLLRYAMSCRDETP